MKKLLNVLTSAMLLLTLATPIFASNYVNPPDYPVPVDSNTQTNPTVPTGNPNTSDNSILPLAIGVFVVATSLAVFLKSKKAERSI